MNIQSIRAIDGIIGIAVFLLLAIAVIASQARATLRPDNAFGHKQAWMLQAEPNLTNGDKRTPTEQSTNLDRVNLRQIRLDGVIDLRKQSRKGSRAIAIPE